MINPLTGGLEFIKHEKSKTESEFPDLNENFCPIMSTLSTEEKIKLVKEVGEEIIGESDLAQLFEKKTTPIVYDGFEPSGRMHIAQGVLRAINVNRLTKAGCIFYFWVADWFAQMNNKMGGDLEKIRTIGRYFVEVWKAAGMDLKNVKFLWASEEINKKAKEYWQNVINIATHNNVKRIIRCCQIMGRKDNEALTAAQIMYPCMQCTDIFFLGADITSLGMDQRKVNMLAREYCNETHSNEKPIIVSHHMLKGLLKDAEKMSKSIPETAIFVEDSKEDVNRKIQNGYCPEKNINNNPIFDYIKYIIFPKFETFELLRDEKNGGNKVYNNLEELSNEYIEGKIHPMDLKNSVAKVINDILEPIRLHFQNDPYAKKVLELVRSYQITR